jgi:hypothetical protein
MASRALDILTIVKCLAELEKELSLKDWKTTNQRQGQVIGFLRDFSNNLSKVTGLDAKASCFYQELNDFLLEKGFSAMFREFDPRSGFGVAAVLDKLVKWFSGDAKEVKIQSGRKKLHGFALPRSDVEIYDVAGISGKLLKLKTKSKDNPWIFLGDDDSLDNLEMVGQSFDIMNRRRSVARGFAGAQVPMVDLDLDPDIGFLTGLSSGDWSLVSAQQKFKMRMNEKGARVKVATAIAVYRSCNIPMEVPFVVDKPFYCWWTQEGLENMPMATSFIDYDCMKKPAGSLEDL